MYSVSVGKAIPSLWDSVFGILFGRYGKAYSKAYPSAYLSIYSVSRGEPIREA